MHPSSNVAPTSLRLRSKLAPRPVNLHFSPDDMPTPPPNSQKSPHKPPYPVLRWFGHTNSSPTPHASTPSSSSHPISPSADTIENLLDALTSPLPALSTPALKRPPRAVPPNMPLSGSPYFLRGLSRVTLPTASLSNLAPAARPFDPPADPQSPGAPIFLQHSPPERSSVDALRSLRNRVSGPSARHRNSSSPYPRALFTTSATPSWWRFQNDNKENIDRLLSEEDRAPTVEEERSRIHKKCTCMRSPLVSSYVCSA
jgi:triacylglycerol lipase